MKFRRFVLCGVMGVLGASSFALAAEEWKSGSEGAPEAKPASAESGAEPIQADPQSRRGGLEKQFKESLTDVVLDGIWQVTGKGGLKGNEPLSEPKKERYTIASIVKTGDEHWIVSARIEYAETDVTVPVLVRVVWAGDTPMITIDDLAIPLIGAYSARVIFHKGFYSGIWYSNTGNYGGILSGRIVKQVDKKERSSGSSDER